MGTTYRIQGRYSGSDYKDRGIFMKITLKYRENKIKILQWHPLMAAIFHIIRLQTKDVYCDFQALDLPYLPKFKILHIILMLTNR